LAVNFERQEVPGMAWLQSKSDWKYLADNGTGKYCMVSFGKKKEFAYGFDAARKGKAKQVTVDFYPSLGGFCGERGAWLTQVEARAKRASKATQATAKPATLKQAIEASADLMVTADYNVSGEVADAFLDMIRAYRDASDANRSMLLALATEVTDPAMDKAQTAA
jgi:hypothetical protein